ncbi:hypothetical protein Trydic_g21570 [Trypoxylus dichotomus]
MIPALIVIIFISCAHSYNYTEETCEEDTLKVVQAHLDFKKSDLIVTPSKLDYIFFNEQYPYQEIILTDENLNLINIELETKIIITGWIEGFDVKWAVDMKNAYVKRGPYNVIIFSWDKYTYLPYDYATPLSRDLGYHLAEYIIYLMNVIKLDLDKTHFIGHSMGSHIAGFAGKALLKKLGRRISRISSLDLAGPGFNLNPPHLRLHKDDADFVDGIHTNSFVLGYRYDYGTADFYVDGGIFQPGCESVAESFQKPVTCASLYTLLFCSHRRSRLIWIESINNDTMIAINNKTGDKVPIGEPCPNTAKGVYYLNI